MFDIENVVHYLKETKENLAAAIIEDGELTFNYYQTMFGVHSGSESEIDVYDLQIKIPAKYFVKINDQLIEEKLLVENAVKLVAESERIIIDDISWALKLINKENISNQFENDRITKHLNTKYVKSQIELMQESIYKAPHLAIGTAKELIETCCKSILKDKNIEIDKNWDLGKLVKETNKTLQLIPDFIEDKEKPKKAVEKILSGFSNLVQGVAELRNSYGNGHGHENDFKTLDEAFARLVTGAASEFAKFYLEVYKREIINVRNDPF